MFELVRQASRANLKVILRTWGLEGWIQQMLKCWTFISVSIFLIFYLDAFLLPLFFFSWTNDKLNIGYLEPSPKYFFALKDWNVDVSVGGE